MNVYQNETYFVITREIYSIRWHDDLNRPLFSHRGYATFRDYFFLSVSVTTNVPIRKQWQ